MTTKITTLALIATAPVAAAIALPATASTDPNDLAQYENFLSPSGNINCSIMLLSGPPVLLAYASHRAFSRSPAYIARNYFGVKPHPGLSAFTDIAERYPVFVVAPEKQAET